MSESERQSLLRQLADAQDRAAGSVFGVMPQQQGWSFPQGHISAGQQARPQHAPVSIEATVRSMIRQHIPESKVAGFNRSCEVLVSGRAVIVVFEDGEVMSHKCGGVTVADENFQALGLAVALRLP